MPRRSSWTHYRNSRHAPTPVWVICLHGLIIGSVGCGLAGPVTP